MQVRRMQVAASQPESLSTRHVAALIRAKASDGISNAQSWLVATAPGNRTPSVDLHVAHQFVDIHVR